MADVVSLGFDLNVSDFNTKIPKANKNLDKFEKNLKGVDTSLKKADKGFSTSTKALSGMTAAFTVLATAATAALTVMVHDIIRVGSEFEATMSKVKAVSGATGDQFKNLSDAAKKLGASTKFTATQSAEGLVLLSQAGLKAEESIKALPTVMKLAQAGNIDMSLAADIATNAVSGMRLGVDDLSHVADVFAQTARTSNTDIRAMGESFTYAASVASSAKISVEQLSGLIAVLAKGGIKGSMAGTQLAAGISKASKAGKEFIPWLKELESQGASTAEIMKIFGERASRGVLTIMGQGTKELDKFIKKNVEANGTLNEMSTIMGDNLKHDFLSAGSAISDLEIGIYEVFGNDMRFVVQSFTKAVRENKDEFIDLLRPIGEAATSMTNFIETAQSIDNKIGNLFIYATVKIKDFLGLQIKPMDKLSTAFTTGFGAIKKSIEGDFAGAFEFWKIGAKDFFGIEDRLSDSVNKTNSSIKNRVKVLASETTETNKNNDIKKQAIEIQEKRIEAIRKEAEEHKKLRNQIRLATEDFQDELRYIKQLEKEQDAAAKKTDWLTDYIKEQDEALNHLGIEYNDITDDSKILSLAIDNTVTSLNDQADAIKKVGTSAEVTAEQVVKMTNFSGTSLGGTTFQMTRPETQNPFASLFSNSSSTSTPQATAASTTKSLTELSRNQQTISDLIQQIQDFQLKDKSAVAQLDEFQSRIAGIRTELSSLTMDDFDKRIELSRDLFSNLRSVDSLQKSIEVDRLSNLETQKSVLANLQSISTEISFDGLLPTEELAAWKKEWGLLKAEVNAIDFSEITSADTTLLEKFKTTSEGFLTAAETVFKSSDNFKDIKATVKSQFDSMASSIKTAIDPLSNDTTGVLKNLTTNAGNAATNLGKQNAATWEIGSTYSGSAKFAADNLGGLDTEIFAVGSQAFEATDEASLLADAVSTTKTPFISLESSLDSLVSKLTTMSAAISGSTVSSTGDLVLGDTATDIPAADIPAPEIPEPITITGFKTDSGNLYTVWSDGKEKPIGTSSDYTYRALGTKATLWHSSNGVGYGTQLKVNSDKTGITTLETIKHISSYDSRMYPKNFKTGTLDTGSGGTIDSSGGFSAILHPHEMVIPQQHAPIVRGLMNSAGVNTSGYNGQGSYANGTMNAMPLSDENKVIFLRQLDLLIEIREALLAEKPGGGVSISEFTAQQDREIRLAS